MFYAFCKKVVVAFLFCFFSGLYAQVNRLDISFFTEKDTLLARVFRQPERFRLQIFLSFYVQDTLRHEYFGDSSMYYYPASLVKFPTVLATLDLLRELHIPQNMMSRLFLKRTFRNQEMFPRDYILLSDSINQRVSLQDHVIRCLLVSDNYSFDYLFELCGRQRIENSCKKYGSFNIHILHHFGKQVKISDTLFYPSVNISDSSGNVLYMHTEKIPNRTLPLNAPGIVVGKRKNNSCREKKFNYFNFIPFPEMHRLFLYFLHVTPMNGETDEENRKLIHRCLLLPPDSVSFYGYDVKKHYQTLKKYLVYGSDRREKLSDTIRIKNIVGQSYGFLADVAEIKTRHMKKPFYLSVVLYTNDKDCFGKGNYEYYETGFPFLKNMGRYAIQYVYERCR